MKAVSNIETWCDDHHPKWLDVIRILLGLVLVAKGISIIINDDSMIEEVLGSSHQLRSVLLIHYVIGMNLVLGLLITFGLLTRIAVLFEIPILLGAIFYFSPGFFTINSELPFLILVLSLLVFFFLYGSGPVSVDNYLRKHSE